MSSKGRHASSRHFKKSPVVLGILSRGDFQRKVKFFSEAPKVHDIFERISRSTSHQLILLGHLESKRLPSHRYGQRHPLLAVQRLAYLIFEAITEVSSPARRPRKISIEVARTAWSNIRVGVWLRVLRRVKADFVIGIGLTNEEILAARRLGITTIEIQHGIFFDGVANFYWPKSSPDFFGLWPATNPRLLDDSGIKPLKIPLPKLSRREDARSGDKVLVPLSWGEVWETSQDKFLGAIPQPLADVLRGGDLSFDRVLFRAHPVFSKRKLRRLRAGIDQIFPGSGLNLSGKESIESFLSRGSILITHESSTWMEALRLGVPVLTTSTRTAQLMSEFHCSRKTPFRFLKPDENLSTAISVLERCLYEAEPRVFGSENPEWEPLDRVLRLELE